MFKKILYVVFTFLFLTPFLLNAQAPDSTPLEGPERILNFNSDIIVNSDSSLLVKETITVVAKGEKIKRGIYRDFPTTYKTKFGISKTSFEVVSVARDSSPENFKVESLGNGKRMYIGNEAIYLQPGVYTYEIVYKTNRQLGFFEDHDELYWNVTGNGWEFDIEQATAHITLPEGVNQDTIKTIAYTGFMGHKGTDYSSYVEKNTAYFATTKKIFMNQGFTIAVAFPKGFVFEPTTQDKIIFFLKDNLILNLGIFFILIILLYFLIQWKKYGDDPEQKSIVVQYDLPPHLSPAIVSYLTGMGFNNKVFTAAIISIATKGYIKIHELKEDKKYTLEKMSSDDSKLSEDEKVLVKEMYPGKVTEFFIRPSDHNLIQHAQDKLEKYLDSSFKDNLFVLNTGKLLAGSFLSGLGIFIGFVFFDQEQQGMLIFLLIFSGLILWNSIFILKNRVDDTETLVLNILKICMFIIVLIPVILALGNSLGVVFLHFLFLISILLCINLLFYFLLKRRTLEGRKIQDNIEGFKLFLSMTEKDRMNFHNPPNKTPELFEKFLPFALALGVENKWAEQFHDVFAQLQPVNGTTYHPSWFVGKDFSSMNFSSSISSFTNSFSNSISSSSVAPGSSSGFGGGGGGGGSGGGGGGGGGGGW